jgi:hypothetical protein
MKINMPEILKHLSIRTKLMIVLIIFTVSSFGASITSLTSGNWSATAWPNTSRTGTIRVVSGSAAVTGTGTLFTTELSVGNIIKNTSNIVIGTVASITDNTHLTLATAPSTSYTNISYRSQGVGSVDAITIASGANITVDGAFACASVSFTTVGSNTTLTISGTNSLTVTGAITMARPSSGISCTLNVGAGSLSAGSLTMSATTSGRNNIITISTGTVTIAGALTTGTTGCQIRFTSSGRFNLGGALSGTPAITQFEGNTWNYYGTSQTLRGTTYNNLILSGSGTKTTTSVTVNGILEMQGTATVSATPAYGLAATLKYNTSTDRTAGLEWTATFAGSGGVIISNTGVITLNGNKVLDNTSLTIEDGATLNTSSSNNYELSIGGLFTNDGVFSANGSLITVAGNWVNNNTFSSGSGTVRFNGGQSQLISGTALSTFNNLSIQNPSGVSLDLDVTVNGTLSFNTGKVITGPNHLILGNSATVSGASSSDYVYGNLVKGIESGTASKNFEIGDASVYAPVTLTFSGTTNGTGSIAAATFSGESPEINSSNIDPSKNVNRYWSLENSGVTGFTSYDAAFTFASGEVDAGSDISSFIAGIYSSLSWDYPEVETTTSTTVQILGSTTFGNFQTGEPRTISGADYGDNGTVPALSNVIPCINIPANHITLGTSFSAGQYFTINVIKGLQYQVYTCNTTSPANPLMLTVYREGAPTDAAIGFSYANTGNPCTSSANNVFLSFIPEFTGQVRILLNRKASVRSATPSGITIKINVSGGSNSADNESASGINSWTGHIYDGRSFNNYLGYYNTTESFQESFGTGGTWPNNTNEDISCFNVYSEGSIRATALIVSYSVRYRMVSDKTGLYTATITSDDGSRLSVDGNSVFSDWTDHSPKVFNNILFNLNGNSELILEYYENGGQNVVGFTNLVKIISNTLTPDADQELCTGVQGNLISGDVFGVLPAGISLSGTGYQWAYSTVSSTGPWTNIAGATSSSFTPSTNNAPFNTPGTYYLIRKAKLSSSNNISPNPYLAESESNAVKITVTQGGRWLGISGSDWNNVSNWCGGVPTSGTNVIIPSEVPNQPVISNAASCNDIIISAGSILTIAASGSLDINGSINNQSGSNGLVLESNATGTASLMHNTNNAEATVKRYFSGDPEAWHFISSPVSDQEIAGDWLPSGSYGNNTGYDLYVWNEATSCWIYKLDVTNTVNWNTVHPGSNFISGKGYLYSVQAPDQTKTFTGILNNGSYSLPVSSSGTDAILKGINLLGNPYPSAIDWQASSGWNRSDLVLNGGGYDMWIWNAAANNYGVISSSGGPGTNGVTRYIAPEQGFFVRADIDGGIEMNNSVRVISESGSWMKKGSEELQNIVNVKVLSEKENGFDEIKLLFGSDKIESGAKKLYSPVLSAPSLYTTGNNEDLSVKYLYDTITSPSVPVMFKPGEDGYFTFSAEFNDDNFNTVILKDLKTNSFNNLKTNKEYRFKASKNDDAARFVLFFARTGLSETISDNVKVFQSTSHLVVDLTSVAGESAVNIIDIWGRGIFSGNLEGETRNELELDSKSQMLIVQIKTAGRVNVKKIMWIRN